MTRARNVVTWGPARDAPAPVRRWDGHPQAHAVIASAPRLLSTSQVDGAPEADERWAGGLLSANSTTGQRTEVWLEIFLATMIIVAIGLLALTR